MKQVMTIYSIVLIDSYSISSDTNILDNCNYDNIKLTRLNITYFQSLTFVVYLL